MSERIQKFLAKPKKIKLCGEDVDIHPLKLKDIDLLLDMQDSVKQNEAIKKVIILTLKMAFPDASDDEIDSVSVEHFTDLTDAILDVNGLDKKKVKT